MSKTECNWEPLSFEGLQTTSLKDRPSKVRIEDFAKPWAVGETLGCFIEKLPAILAADQFRDAAQAVAEAVRNDKTVILGMGAHPIKVGLNPVLVDAMEEGIIRGLALNGAGIIHDVEVALAGKTSEDVAAHLGCGQFGTARETAEFIHGAVAAAFKDGNMGLGRAVGRRLVAENVPFAHLSLLATAFRLNIPVTVHVAVGTDIIHMHPAMDGAAMGWLSHYDFKLFCRLVTTLHQGVFINLGSAVILPEVFLKAVSVAHNLGFGLDGITTINMDFQRQYRPQVNVIQRPTAGTGKGISLIGHHEIMFPLFMATVKECLSREK
ncbi:hypothetical protein [Desulforhabdus amnigena]|uniref:Uncharacterized protein n=1 Tax=Desulforhabdus amnigena TaxID=40218 RepID=A0A9W6FWU0_9BACT|nr:hypothetical protein [Desulforhabdus amnigena]NLJ29857.1 hypothetical protein [Deltaproteobacteria bacterium]GLI36272.1 hypothetical protein DAMNIGENAA_37050 [Desulforhabdus amnigena]